MVCETLDDISSLDPNFRSGFVFDEETVAAGNVGEDGFIVQVCRSKVVLLNHELAASSIFHVDTSNSAAVPDVDGASAALGGFICSAVISDPFVLLRLSSNRAILLKLDAEQQTLVEVAADFGDMDVMSASLFVDVDCAWLRSWGLGLIRPPHDGADGDGDSAALLKVKAEDSASAVVPASAKAGGNSSSMLVDLDDEEMDIFGGSSSGASTSVDPGNASASGGGDPLDDDLFGGSGAAADAVKHEPGTATGSNESYEELPTRHFCVVSRAGGVVEIFLIGEEAPTEGATSLELVFTCNAVPRASACLHDSRFARQSELSEKQREASLGGESTSSTQMSDASSSTPDITEICMAVIDMDGARPVLVCVLESGDVLAKRAYSHPGTGLERGQQFIGFCSVAHDHLFAPTRHERQEQEESTADTGTMVTPRLIPFGLIGGNPDEGGYSGIFVCGARPAWILSERECVRVHPMDVDGRVRSLTPLNTVNCRQGFVTLNAEAHLKICRLPQEVQYGGPWPFRKIPLKATGHRIVYHATTGTYAVVTSKLVEVEAPTPAEQVDENGIITSMDLSAAEESGPKAKRLPRAAEQFQIRVFAPHLDWETVDTYDLLADEHVLCATCLSLVCATRVGTARAKVSHHIAVGTGQAEGEDRTCKGRLIMLGIESTLTGPRIVEGFIKEEKGPISALAQLKQQYVVGTAGTAIDPTHRGTTVIVHRWKVDDEGKGKLTPAAFYHCQMYVTVLRTLPGSVSCPAAAVYWQGKTG
jgi:hypothetical protein